MVAFVARYVKVEGKSNSTISELCHALLYTRNCAELETFDADAVADSYMWHADGRRTCDEELLIAVAREMLSIGFQTWTSFRVVLLLSEYRIVCKLHPEDVHALSTADSGLAARWSTLRDAASGEEYVIRWIDRLQICLGLDPAHRALRDELALLNDKLSKMENFPAWCAKILFLLAPLLTTNSPIQCS